MIPYTNPFALTKRQPWMTLFLVLINTLVFIALSFSPSLEVFQKWGFTPAHPSFLTIVTSMFIHANFFHLFGNMYFLWLVGHYVEEKTGPWVFLFFYLTGHLMGIITYWAFSGATYLNAPLGGASAAISTIFGIYAVFFPMAKIALFSIVGWNLVQVTVHAGFLALVWFFSQLFWASSSFKHPFNIAYWAHVGGFVLGLGAGFIMRKYFFTVKDLLLPDQFQAEGEKESLVKEDVQIHQEEKEVETLRPSLIEKVETDLAQNKIDQARGDYKKFEDSFVGGALSAQAQKKLGDGFFENNDPYRALQAYFKFLLKYSKDGSASEVYLKSGLILSKSFNDQLHALNYLIKGLKNSFGDVPETLKNQARQELEKIRAAFQQDKELESSDNSKKYSVVLLDFDVGDIPSQDIYSYLLEIGMVGDINLGQKLCFNAEDNIHLKDAIVLNHLTVEEASQACDKLKEKKVDAIALIEDKYKNYPIIYLKECQKISDNFIFFDEQRNSINLNKNNVFYTALGQFFYEKRALVSNEENIWDVQINYAFSEGASEDLKNTHWAVDDIELNLVLDIFTNDFIHYRLSSSNFSYKNSDGQAGGPFEHMGMFIEDLVKSIGEDKVDFNVKLFIGDNNCTGIFYRDINEYEKKAFWAARLKKALEA